MIDPIDFLGLTLSKDVPNKRPPEPLDGFNGQIPQSIGELTPETVLKFLRIQGYGDNPIDSASVNPADKIVGEQAFTIDELIKKLN